MTTHASSTASSPTTSMRSSAGPGIALAGLGWNAFGLFQFFRSLQNTPESLARMGMTAAQAQVYGSYPIWMSVAFAVGAGGGLIGCALLLIRDRRAVPVFAASLAGYVLLYIGDITEGVFAALGAPQVNVLTLVVAIAAGLMAWSRRELRRGILA